MKWYFKINLLVRIFIGLLAGAILGILITGLNTSNPELLAKILGVINPLGALFVSALKMVVVPLVFSSLLVGVSTIDHKTLGRVGGKAFALFFLSSMFAVFIGLVIANIFRPGMGLNFESAADVAGRELNHQKFSDILVGIIPKNPISALASGHMLQIIFFSLMCGIGTSLLRHSDDDRKKTIGNTVYNFFDGFTEVMYLIVRWVMEYAPIGVFGLIAGVFAKQGASVTGPLVKVTLVFFLAYIIHMILVFPLFLKVGGLNIRTFFRKARPATLTAFVTRSSSGTLPVSMQATEDLGVPKSTSSFVLPLGSTINMDGTSIYEGVAVIFLGYAIGQPLGIGQQIVVVFTALLAAIGTAGVPGAGALMLLIIIQSVGFNMEAGSPVAAAYALILGIDALLDMGRTALNVTGDIMCSTLVSKSEKTLDMEQFNRKSGITR